jgi:hypothetical protein
MQNLQPMIRWHDSPGRKRYMGYRVWNLREVDPRRHLGHSYDEVKQGVIRVKLQQTAE